MKTLIAYYSQSGQTKQMAELLAGKIKADLYEIVPERKYDDDMWKAWEEAQEERRENSYPALKGDLPDLSNYDTVILGTGIWGLTMANPLISFLQKMDFTGKKMSAFWTFYDHDEKVNEDLKRSLKNAEYVDGLPLPRSLTGNAEKLNETMDAWIRKNALI
jgi:flavodoxin